MTSDRRPSTAPPWSSAVIGVADVSGAPLDASTVGPVGDEPCETAICDEAGYRRIVEACLEEEGYRTLIWR